SLGSFELLGHKQTFGQEPDWFTSAQSRLWRFHLHYFEYAMDLAIWDARAGGREGFETFRRLVLSWIRKNALLQGDGWHPYTLSVRIVNWCLAINHFQQRLNEDCEFRSAIHSSLFGQAQILAKSLEHDVRGNHLIKNLKALIWAGTV